MYILSLIIAILISACSPTISERRTYALGTFITIKIYQQNIPASVWNKVFEYIEDVEQRMSASTKESELIKLQELSGKTAIRVSADVYSLLQKGKQISLQTNGLFNIAILPLVQLWDITAAHPKAPQREQVINILPLLDFNNVKLLPKQKVLLSQPGMGVDLGGIAKGYIAEQIAYLLKKEHISSALIDLGGNIHVIGTKPDKQPWIIGIRDPQGNMSQIIGTVKVTDGYSMVTSGAYERYFMQDGIRYHHIFDSQTGYPAESDLESVTIVTKNGTLADALSTAFFVAGSQQSINLAKKFSTIGYILVLKNKKILYSPSLKMSFILRNTTYTAQTYP